MVASFVHVSPPLTMIRNIHVHLLITGRNEIVAKVIFLHLSVIHSVHRGGSASVHAGIPPPPGSRPPGSDTPWDQTPFPLRADTPQSRYPPRADTPRSRHPQEQTPPPSRHPLEQRPPRTRPPLGSRLQHTVYERPVRILLECILVEFM